MSRPVYEGPPSRDEHAADWCVRLAEAPLTGEETRMFDAWIAEADNARAFEDALAVWRSVEAVADKPELVHIRAEALESFRRANSRRWSRSPARWYWSAAVAATVLVIAISAFLMRDPMQVYDTGVGERRIAMLDDGSRLSLDAATEVEVRLRDDHRELHLIKGRAKFDVARDPLRPFSVIAGDKMVVATGTSFSVELLRRQVRVFLYEGHVAVLEKAAASAKPTPVRLNSTATAADQALVPGQELVASLTAPIATVIAGDAPRSLAWESGQLNFDNEPLGSAVERMNRYSREKLVVGDQDTGNLLVNGVFTAGDSEAFIEGVTALDHLKVAREGDQVTLKRN